jgi:hypothetical protein
MRITVWRYKIGFDTRKHDMQILTFRLQPNLRSNKQNLVSFGFR